MAIGVYLQPPRLTLEQFRQVDSKVGQYLQENNLENPVGALHLSVFGDDGQLAVFNIWESEEAFRKFGEILMPLLAEAGIHDAEPQIVPIHRLAQIEATLG
jgi:hypothetical protein